MQVDRTQADLDNLVDEVICTGERIVGDIKDAVDDLMGYDSEYAAFLIQRDEEERKRQEYLEELRSKETPLQRQQRMAREARMAKRNNVRTELYRDDRNPIQRLRDAAKAINFKNVCRKLEQHGMLMHRWQAATLATLMFMMLATNLTVMGKGGEIQSAPNSYTTYCTHCNHKYSVKRSHFEEYSFYDVHPKDFKLQYHKDQPDYPACPECGIVHQKLILVSRPDRDERFLLATNPLYQMPIDQEGVQKLCEKYN
jgi:transposase